MCGDVSNKIFTQRDAADMILKHTTYTSGGDIKGYCMPKPFCTGCMKQEQTLPNLLAQQRCTCGLCNNTHLQAHTTNASATMAHALHRQNQSAAR
jgi:hypothetical protein